MTHAEKAAELLLRVKQVSVKKDYAVPLEQIIAMAQVEATLELADAIRGTAERPLKPPPSVGEKIG